MIIVIVAFAESGLPTSFAPLTASLPGIGVPAIEAAPSATPNRTKAISTTTTGTKAISRFSSTPS